MLMQRPYHVANTGSRPITAVKTTLGVVSTWMGDRLGTPCAVGITFTLVAGLLASSHYPEGPATGHLGTGFSWFPCVYKRMLR